MADNKIPGNIIGVQIGSLWLSCQADATLNIKANTTESALCKILDGTAGANPIPWKTFNIDSREWSITVNGALLKDSFAVANAGTDLAKLIIDGNMAITNVLFRTATSQKFADYDMIYSGPAILTDFTINAPDTGANTTAATFQGNGALTYSYPPKTT